MKEGDFHPIQHDPTVMKDVFDGCNWILSNQTHKSCTLLHRNSLSIALWLLRVVHKAIIRTPCKICLLELLAIANFISSVESSSGFGHHLPFAKTVMLSFYATKAVHWDFFSAARHRLLL
jgi:hypothetical protein